MMNVREAVEHIRSTVKDAGGAGVWTADFFVYVLLDCGEREEEITFAKALEILADEDVLERVGRNGYQVREEWLEDQGFSVEEVGL